MNLIKTPLGIVLLFLGLALIFYSLYTSFNIFTGNAEAPQVFKEQIVAQETGGQDLQAQLQNMLEQQLKGMLPFDSITNLLNLISWSILAGILIFGGAQVAGLGIKLIK